MHGRLAAHVPPAWIGVAVVLCWMEEGIFKTYQSRLADRLLRVESLLQQAESSSPAMQLHSEWTARRPGGMRLIAGYAASACRPTVAFPYLPILAIWIGAKSLSWA